MNNQGYHTTPCPTCNKTIPKTDTVRLDSKQRLYHIHCLSLSGAGSHRVKGTYTPSVN